MCFRYSKDQRNLDQPCFNCTCTKLDPAQLIALTIFCCPEAAHLNVLNGLDVTDDTYSVGVVGVLLQMYKSDAESSTLQTVCFSDIGGYGQRIDAGSGHVLAAVIGGLISCVEVDPVGSVDYVRGARGHDPMDGSRVESDVLQVYHRRPVDVEGPFWVRENGTM